MRIENTDQAIVSADRKCVHLDWFFSPGDPIDALRILTGESLIMLVCMHALDKSSL